MSDVSALFQSIKLPVMPEVAHALIRTLHDEGVSVSQVRDIIAKDPTLTAKLLRLANSAGFGLRREIGSLDYAITMIGMSQIRSLALSACMNVAFPTIPGLDRADFWRSSMACAGYAQWLAADRNLDAQQAWLAGMMARLGEILIGQHQPGSLAEIERQPQIPGERWARERRMLGFTETQVTAELARRWDFPAAIVQALEVAADPMSATTWSALGGVLHLAGWLADMPFSEPVIMDALPTEVVSTLGIDLESMRQRIPQPDSFFDLSAL